MAVRNSKRDQMSAREQAGEEAAIWLVRLAEASDDVDLRTRFELWHAASDVNAVLWARTRRAYQLLGLDRPRAQSRALPAPALPEGLRATLAGDAPALERHYRIRLEGSQDSWLLTLTPRAEKLAGLVTQIRIAGARARLKRIEVDESSGDQSIMLIGPQPP